MPRAKRASSSTSRGGSSRGEREQWAHTYRHTPYHELPWFHTFAEPWLVEAFEKGWVSRAGKVLDIGCGAGTNVLWFSEKGFHAVGADLSPGAVHAAEARRREKKDRGAAFVAGDALLLPFRDGTFELASDIGCFHTLPIARREDYARELARVVRPGGHALLSFFAREETMAIGPPHRPSIQEAASALEGGFIFERLEYRVEREDGASFRSYQLLLRRRTEPQPPPR
jgi:SAM-dependent methyltransferase